MTTELEYKPPFELWKTNHGIDGWDAKSWMVARFTTYAKAMAYLKDRGFTYLQDGTFWHADEKNRNTMGAITYAIKEVKDEIPVDPT